MLFGDSIRSNRSAQFESSRGWCLAGAPAGISLPNLLPTWLPDSPDPTQRRFREPMEAQRWQLLKQATGGLTAFRTGLVAVETSKGLTANSGDSLAGHLHFHVRKPGLEASNRH